ncbi:MAG: hypothetical protein RIS34_2544 [Pseudomonadota bacterium]
MGPYEESNIEVLSIRDSILKRPAMLLGDLQDGAAYARTIQALVHATLSWQIGANVGIKLKANNAVELYCYSGLPQGQKAYEHRWSRPIHIVMREMALFGDFSLDFYVIACSQITFEIRDQFASGSAVFQDGYCRSAAESAPNLPAHLCFRVTLKIGTAAIQIAPATMAQVARVLRYMSGPAEAGYWGCVSIEDLRTEETLDLLVTDPPPGPYWRELPGSSSI